MVGVYIITWFKGVSLRNRNAAKKLKMASNTCILYYTGTFRDKADPILSLKNTKPNISKNTSYLKEGPVLSEARLDTQRANIDYYPGFITGSQNSKLPTTNYNKTCYHYHLANKKLQKKLQDNLCNSYCTLWHTKNLTYYDTINRWTNWKGLGSPAPNTLSEV